jgi:Zn-dependent protease
MLLSEPPPSPGDLHFRLFGIPVRVHPFFWLMTVLLVYNSSDGMPPAQLLIWVAVVFGSVLVHELGHALMQRHYGGHPWITLHAIGGLSSCDDCDRRPTSQIVISLAGPAAGFLAALAVVAALRVAGHGVAFEWGEGGGGFPGMVGVPMWIATLWVEPFESWNATYAMWSVLEVNILWGLVNLLPIYPLDGGRVSREICTLSHPRRGVVVSLQISMIAAGIMALTAALAWKSFFSAFLFGYLAYSSYRTLEAYRRSAW